MKLYNTLTSVNEEIDLSQEKINIYLCGVTVYDECHIGHARTIIIFDVLRRYLESKNIEINFIQNFTDIDDKIIARAIDEKTSTGDISTKYIKSYFRDFNALNVRNATTYPLVTENINEIIDFITGLIAKNKAYLGLNGVYYRVSAFSEYGKLSKKDIDQMDPGARIEVDETKSDPRDFALWKFSSKNPTWSSPWGKGRPGWHIECSAMALKYLGSKIDIHGGGQDLIFPHHENEIAQSEGLLGTEFAKLWMHIGMVTINSEKMSKSLGNTIKISELIKTTGPNVIRLFCLSSHYSKPLDYTENIILEIKNKWRQIANAYHELEFRIRNKITTEKSDSNPNEFDMEWSQYFEDFEKELENDLNFSIAMTSFFRFINKLNQILSINNNLSMTFLDNSFNTLEKFLDIIGLEMSRIDDKERLLIEKEIVKRNQFRKEKKYDESDRVRSQLELKYNIDLIDHKNYTFWKKKTLDDF
ncbi:MAG TPA: cysteine--tRNA ligase [Candidatus Nitrosocosmicus sp.]|nr:cysteine--tRNA ligase [Candidatus Nitrosocosmicus sp.]